MPLAGVVTAAAALLARGWVPAVALVTMSMLYFVLTAGTFNSLGLMLPDMVRAFGMDWAQAGFGFTLLGMSCGLASLGPAFMIRRIGIGGTLLAGTAMLVAGFLTMFAATGVASYDCGAILLGLGFCFCGTVPAVHVLTSLFSRRSAALGAYFTIGGLGSVAGPQLVWLAKAAGLDWRAYWLGFAAPTALLGGFAAIVTRGIASRTRADAATVASDPAGPKVRRALRSGRYWLIVAVYTACLAVNTTTHSFAFQHLVEHGMSALAATQLISLAALFSVGGSALAGVVGERVGARRLTLLALGTLGVAAAMLAIGHGLIVLTLWVLAYGVGLGLSYVATAMLLQEYFGARASLELYSIMTAISTSAALGPALGGTIRDRTGSFSGIFIPLAAISFGLLLALAKLRKPTIADSAGH